MVPQLSGIRREGKSTPHNVVIGTFLHWVLSFLACQRQDPCQEPCVQAAVDNLKVNIPHPHGPSWGWRSSASRRLTCRRPRRRGSGDGDRGGGGSGGEATKGSPTIGVPGCGPGGIGVWAPRDFVHTICPGGSRMPKATKYEHLVWPHVGTTRHRKAPRAN